MPTDKKSAQKEQKQPQKRATSQKTSEDGNQAKVVKHNRQIPNSHPQSNDQEETVNENEENNQPKQDYSGILDMKQTYKEWNTVFRMIMEKVTPESIMEFEHQYRGSEDEVNDVLKLYTEYKGDMNMICKYHILSEPKDEDRIYDIIDEHVDAQKVTHYDAYKDETKAGLLARRNKFDHEARKATKLAKTVDRRRKVYVPNNDRIREQKMHDSSRKLIKNYSKIQSVFYSEPAGDSNKKEPDEASDYESEDDDSETENSNDPSVSL